MPADSGFNRTVIRPAKVCFALSRKRRCNRRSERSLHGRNERGARRSGPSNAAKPLVKAFPVVRDCVTDPLLRALGVSFAIIAGTSAGILAVLSWEIFRESPFGTVIALLSVIMSATTVYHVVLLVAGSETLLLRVLRSGVNTVIAAFVVLAVHSHRRLQRDSPRSE